METREFSIKYRKGGATRRYVTTASSSSKALMKLVATQGVDPSDVIEVESRIVGTTGERETVRTPAVRMADLVTGKAA